jgi:hypothetical protein
MLEVVQNRKLDLGLMNFCIAAMNYCNAQILVQCNKLEIILINSHLLCGLIYYEFLINLLLDNAKHCIIQAFIDLL